MNEATFNSIELAWTASGDDGSTEAEYGYDLRYSASPIDDTKWADAARDTGESLA